MMMMMIVPLFFNLSFSFNLFINSFDFSSLLFASTNLAAAAAILTCDSASAILVCSCNAAILACDSAFASAILTCDAI